MIGDLKEGAVERRGNYPGQGYSERIKNPFREKQLMEEILAEVSEEK